MAKITYEHQTDGVFCGDDFKVNKQKKCCFKRAYSISSDLCVLFMEEIQNEEHPIKFEGKKVFKTKRCQQCLDKFGK